MLANGYHILGSGSDDKDLIRSFPTLPSQPTQPPAPQAPQEPLPLLWVWWTVDLPDFEGFGGILGDKARWRKKKKESKLMSYINLKLN